METFKGSTVAEAKLFLRANFEKGVACPCCAQHVQAYSRKITSAMCFALFIIYRKFRNDENEKLTEYVHVEELLKETRCNSTIRADVPKMRFFGLIEPKREIRDDHSPRNGYYRITEKGEQFLKGEIKIPSHVILYNNKALGFSDKMVDINQALKNKFSYRELMEGLAQ